MVKETLIQIYERDLRKVVEEIKAYKNDADLWILEGEITNSGGNLALHLIGNINHFFGAVLAGTDYKRDRDLEFSEKKISRAEIIEHLENAVKVLTETLRNLSEEGFQKDYPQEFGGETHKTLSVIISMLSHLNYHLGQINYHRRLLSK